MIPPGAKSTRFIEIPRVFTPGNARTFAGVTADPNIVVFPSLLSPSKKKSPEVTSAASLQGKPLREAEAFKSATQKSCKGSGSAEYRGRGRINRSTRQHSSWKCEIVERIMVSGYFDERKMLVYL